MSMKKTSAAVFVMSRFIAMQDGAPVSLAALRENCGLSKSYIEQIFACLLKCGLVDSYRGPGGGYMCHPDMTVGDIVLAFVSSGYMRAAPVIAALNGIRIADLPEGFSL
ncbi:RrF2 family transcriptional regulator [Enterobacter asburiae]|uniref:RrF2 family transcriptional regulator n=1 Tax=Enterobacter asburiae TaxID=61645 RepID=UPI00192BBB48|nr:Rrf2 family transcriptional regulator [Enterobacter asburiae]MBL5911263.1 Rrf2 family transcriptional regulator [Enterobacter asburiae]